MIGRAIAIGGFALLLAAPLHAQRTLGSAAEDVKHVLGDALYVGATPFRTDADDVPRLLAAAAGFGAATLLDEPVQRWIRSNPGSAAVRAFDPWSDEHLAWLGDTQHLLQISGAMYAVGFAADSRDLRDAALGCITADGTGSLIRHGIYELVSRERPYNKDTGEHVEDGDHWAFPGGDWSDHSFFGGHVANIMSCVSFWNHRFDMGVAEPVLYGFATALGVERTLQEAHWTSDTMLGILVGYLIGAQVAHRYAEREGKAGGLEAAGLEPEAGVVQGPDGRSALYAGVTWRF